MAIQIAFLISTAVAVAITLSLTAVWGHHLELIALPATFAICLLTTSVNTAARSRWKRLGALGVIVVVCATSVGGLPVKRDLSRPLSDWLETPYSASADALDAGAAKVSGPRAPVNLRAPGHER